MTFIMAVQSPSAKGRRGDAEQQRDAPPRRDSPSAAIHLGAAAPESLKDAKTVQSPLSEGDPDGAGGKEQQTGVHDVEAPRGLHVALPPGPPGGRMRGKRPAHSGGKTEASEQGSCSPFRLGRRGGHPVLVPFWPRDRDRDSAGKQSQGGGRSSQGATSSSFGKSRAAGAGSRGRRAAAGNACDVRKTDGGPQEEPQGKQGTLLKPQTSVERRPGDQTCLGRDSGPRESLHPQGRGSLGGEETAAASPVESSAPEPQAQGATPVAPSSPDSEGLDEQERWVVEESSEQEGKEKEEEQEGKEKEEEQKGKEKEEEEQKEKEKEEEQKGKEKEEEQKGKEKEEEQKGKEKDEEHKGKEKDEEQKGKEKEEEQEGKEKEEKEQKVLGEVLIQPHPPSHHEEEEADGAGKAKVLSEVKGEEQERDGAAGASETNAESVSPSTQPSDTQGPEAEKPKELNKMQLSEGQERGGSVGTISKQAASGSLGTQPRDTKAPPCATTTTPQRSVTTRRHAHRRLRSCNARLDAAFDAGLLSSPLPERRHARSKSSRALSLSQGECPCTGTLCKENPARGGSTVPHNELAQCSARSLSSNALGVAAVVLADETRRHESPPEDDTPLDTRDQRANVAQ